MQDSAIPISGSHAMPARSAPRQPRFPHSLIMVDFAATDPRSVGAALRGGGDGRAQIFLSFAAALARADPTLTDAEIAAAYHDACHRDLCHAALHHARREHARQTSRWARLLRAILGD